MCHSENAMGPTQGAGLCFSWMSAALERDSVMMKVFNSHIRLSLQERVHFTCISFVVNTSQLCTMIIIILMSRHVQAYLATANSFRSLDKGRVIVTPYLIRSTDSERRTRQPCHSRQLFHCSAVVLVYQRLSARSSLARDQIHLFLSLQFVTTGNALKFSLQVGIETSG